MNRTPTIALLVCFGWCLLAGRPAVAQGTSTASPTPKSAPPAGPAAPAQGVGVDYDLIGSFTGEMTTQGIRYRHRVEITLEGGYRWVTEQHSQGALYLDGGALVLKDLRSGDGSDRTRLEVSFPNVDSLVTVGPLGRAEWRRIGKAENAATPLHGAWEMRDPTGAVACRLEVNLAKKQYAFSLSNTQTGTFEAANGQYRSLQNGQVVSAGQYTATDQGFSLMTGGILASFDRVPGSPRPDLLAVVDRVPPSPGIASKLYSHGVALRDAGRLREAIPLLEKAVAVARKVWGDFTEGTAGYANTLANAYYNNGMFAQADEWFRSTIQVLLRVKGPNDPSVGKVAMNYGQLLQAVGDVIGAEETYAHSERILRASGASAETMAVLWVTQAMFDDSMGRTDRAEGKLRGALEVFEKAYGPNSDNVAMVCTNLGSVLESQGRQAEALAAYQRCLAIREAIGKATGRVQYGGVLCNLAGLQRDLGDLEAAEKLYRADLELNRREHGEDHPNVATAWYNMAAIFSSLDRLPEAEDAWNRGREIDRRSSGEDHPDMIPVWAAGASLSALGGRWPEAVERMERSRRMARQYMAQILPALPMRDALAWLRTDAIDRAVSFALRHPNDPAMVEKAWSWWINRKGVGEESLAQMAVLERVPSDAAVAARVAELQDVRRQLSALVSMLPGRSEDDARAYVENLRSLSRRESELTRELSRAGVRGAVQEWVDPSELRARIPTDTVLLDYVRFVPSRFAPGAKGRHEPARYGAWIVSAGDTPIRFVDLGDAAALDACVGKARTLILAMAKEDPVSPEADRAALREVAIALLDPLGPAVAGAKRWWISPDGELWNLPWSALVVAEGAYAVEKHEVELRVSARDLLATPGPKARSPGLLCAFPNYALSAQEALQTTIRLLGGTGRTSFAARLNSGRALGSADPLPGTLKEAKAVQPLFDRWTGATSVLRVGAEALEGVVKAVAGPRFLYLATHGGYFATAEDEERCNLRVFALHQSPLLRTNVLLAGSDQCVALGAAGIDDGVLTSLEAASLDLAGTEIVVLSACHTGEGVLQAGEATASQRQAFQIAGARAVIATLWPVLDEASAVLMTKFGERLAEGDDPGVALRSAQLALLATADRSSVLVHPIAWSAYTLTRR